MSDDSTNDNLADLLRDLTEHPMRSLKSLRKQFSAFEQGVTDQLYQYLASVVALFYEVEASPELQGEIIKKTKFQSKKELTKKKLLRLVFRYVLKAGPKGLLFDRACKYTGALIGEVEKKTDPKDIPHIIRDARGIDNLYHLAKGNAGTGEDTTPGDDSSDDDEGLDDGEETNSSGDSSADDGGADLDERARGGDAGGPVKGSGPPQSEAVPNKPKRIPFDKHKDLIVRFVSEDELADLFESKFDRINLQVSLQYNGDGFVEALVETCRPM